MVILDIFIIKILIQNNINHIIINNDIRHIINNYYTTSHENINNIIKNEIK